MLSISLDGFTELQRRLEGATRGVSLAVDAAVEATAREAQAVARQEAPRDTGRLANSIAVREPAPLVRDVYTNVAYAMRQNYGFVGTDRLGRTYNQPGFFFMEKAEMEAAQHFPGRVSRALRDTLGVR